MPCLPLQSVTSSQNYYNVFSNFCIKWPKALNIAIAFLYTEGSECRNAAFLWHSLEISIVSQESTLSLLNTLHLPQNNSPPFHQGNLDQAPSFNRSASPCLFLNASRGGGEGERHTPGSLLPSTAGRKVVLQTWVCPLQIWRSSKGWNAVTTGPKNFTLNNKPGTLHGLLDSAQLYGNPSWHHLLTFLYVTRIWITKPLPFPPMHLSRLSRKIPTNYLCEW